MTSVIRPCLRVGEKDISKDVKLYRYLPTNAFLYLITFKELLFTRITDWPDSFEGSRFDFLKKISTLKDDFPGLTKYDFFAMCWSLQSEDRRLFNNDEDHKNAVEEILKNGSAAMWENYCKNGGVRIATTVDKLNMLLESKTSNCTIYRGKVYYEPERSWDITIKVPTLISTLFHKRISFRYEDEYRYIFVPNEKVSNSVIGVKIENLYWFLDEILVSPATSKNKWISQTLYHIGVELTINKDNKCVNSKDNHRFCRISQLYEKVSEIY